MKKFLLAASTVAALAAIDTANAADLALKAPPPPAPVYSWTGWYAGLNVGGSFGRAADTATYGAPPVSFIPGSTSANLDGVMATIQQAPMGGFLRKAISPTFDGRLDDHDHAIAVYERHNAEVRRSIAPERLLVYDAAEGWEPLCRFLGVPIPGEPFPHANSTEEFRARVAARGR